MYLIAIGVFLKDEIDNCKVLEQTRARVGLNRDIRRHRPAIIHIRVHHVVAIVGRRVGDDAVQDVARLARVLVRVDVVRRRPLRDSGAGLQRACGVVEKFEYVWLCSSDIIVEFGIT